MPYRHAHWFVAALFPLAALAFWKGYLSQIATAPLQLHAHGLTASLWLALLTTQSWSIHHGRRAWHRAAGAASLLLFPLFMAGGMSIFLGMAQRYADNVSPFYELYATRLAWLDILAAAGFAGFYFAAMRRRRAVRLHAGYLLATTIFLLPPILGRLAPALPPLSPAGPQELWKLGVGFQLANAVAAGIAFLVAVRARGEGRPFWLAGLLTVLGAGLYQTVGGLPAWHALYLQAARLPILPLALAAGAAGAAIAYAGWTAGRRPALPSEPVPA